MKSDDVAILRWLADHEDDGVAIVEEIAAELGRDPAEVGRAMRKLAAESYFRYSQVAETAGGQQAHVRDVYTSPRLTAKGRAALDAAAPPLG